ncbi:MAG TPA: hypothetical protein VNN72_21955 [Polyangiaceae bacterium]|nr:hypothetical protein [Polyangiaceae bacterium]
MARRLLSLVLAPAVVAALGCQVDPIAIVDCHTTADCETGMLCSPEHACVPLPDAGDMPDGGMMAEPPPNHAGDLLTWDALGNVSADENEFEISGPWFLYDDCGSVLPQIENGSFVCPADAATKSCCTERDESLAGPPPLGDPGWSVTAGVPGETSGSACVRLTTAAHVTSWQWGAGLALNLNNWGAFDASRARSGGRIIGFSFDIESGRPGSVELQVGIGTTDNDSHFQVLAIPARGAKLLFEDLPYNFSNPGNPLDLTAATRINFAMPSIESATVFDFCVTNLRVLHEAPDLPGP